MTDTPKDQGADSESKNTGVQSDTSLLGPFVMIPEATVFGHPLTKDNVNDQIWEWSYALRPNRAAPTPKEHELAHKIARLAGSLDEAGVLARHDGKTFTEDLHPGDRAAMDIMDQLSGVFSAALVGSRSGDDLTIYTTMVDDLEKDFFRRVITARMRNKLMAPVRLTLIGFLVALLLGFMTPQFEAWSKPAAKPPAQAQVAQPAALAAASTATPAADQPAESAGKDDAASEEKPGFPWDLFRALSFVVAGTLMGRLLFFALTHNGRIETFDQHYALKAQLTAPEITLLFDVAIGATAFAVFQTGFVVIAIGGEAGNAEAGISSLQIGSDGLIAFVFGVLVGISRIAFLSRIKAISDEQLKTAAK